MIAKSIFKLFIAPVIKYRYNSYLEELKTPELSQKRLLDSIIRKISSTKYGQEHQIKNKLSLSDFQRQIPFNSYDSLSKYLENDHSYHNKYIVNPSAILWEKTSGSSQKKKLIPYNRYALRDFRDMIVYWTADLLMTSKSLIIRKIFFSVSLHLDTNSGIENDTDYLPWYFQLFFKKYLLIPKDLQKIKDSHSFNLYLCSHLLLDRDINILFIWSPTYLISLMEFIKENKIELLKILKMKNFEYNLINFPIHARNERGIDEIEKLINSGQWKEIDVISCWVDGSSKYFLDELKTYFPNAEIQGKGLLATEAPITYPSKVTNGYLPLINNIFYEFLDSHKQVKLIHELEIGKKYELIISNRSGLIRYQMNDIIEITSFFQATPCFKFISRTGMSVDLTGEKLDLFTIESIFEKLSINDDSFLCPILDSPSYYLFVTKSFDNKCHQIEDELLTHHHYQQSRKLNQLKSIQVFKHNNPKNLYNNILMHSGMKLGDIKFNRIITKPIKRAKLDLLN